MEAQERELTTLRAGRDRAGTFDSELGLPQGPAQPPSSSMEQRGLVDTRQLGKPEKFSGDPATFEDWSFILEAYVSCVDRRYIAMFETRHATTAP